MASTKKYSKRSNTHREFIFLACLVVVLVAVFILLQPKRLDYVEVSDYRGQKLSSINDIQDNAIAGTQNINIQDYMLSVDGLIERPKNYTYDDVINGYQHYEKVVTIYCVEGWNAKILWEGLLLKDLLNQTELSPNANTIIFHAKDGYTTSLPLDYIMENNILLAYKMNGLVIPPEKGFPFQVVAESKLGYKWAKWVTRIEVSDDENYQGYWERRGYTNTADA
jgi:DMSO/TMAO reductase YedYZ molybdopterin-dependent catalytic subunit